MQKDVPTTPSVGSDRTMPWVLPDLGGYPSPRSALVTDLLVLVLHSHRDVKIDDFQTKVLFDIDNKVVRLDIPVSDTMPVKIREAFDEVPADLNDFVRSGRKTSIDAPQFG